MLKSEAAAYLAGVTQTEGAEASAPTNLHVITGEVGESSADGKTLIKIDGLMFSENDDQYIEVDALGGLEEGDIATIVLTGEQGHAMTPLALGSIGSVDRITVRIAAIEADYIKVEQLDAAKARIGELEADHVSVNDFNAATGRIGTLETTRATITDLNAATARIGTLEADHVSTDDFNAATGRIGTLETNTADIGTIRANSAKVQNLTADELEADHATVGSLSTNYAHITNGVIDNATIGYADVNNLSAHYAEIQNGKINSALIDTAAIVDEQVFTVTGNKATLAQIDASKINVLNLKAKDIEVERINGQPVTNKTLVDALSQHETDISGLDTKIDNEVEALNDRIDGAIETFTGTVVPTLSNTPASQWNTAKLKDQHVGDVYYVVNSQSAQNGYCYRFTKSGSTYSWQLIKDSDVTAALSRLQTAEGKIGDIEQFDVTVGSFMTDTDDELSSLKTRTTSLETSIGDKVDTSTFNTVSQKVDTNEANITSMSTVLTNNGLTSSTNITNTVNTVKQTADTNKASITSLTQTVNNKADSSTVTTLTQRTSTIEQNLSGITTRVGTAETNIANETALRKAGYATSTTAIGTAAKVATITPAVTDFALYSGCTITVRFDKGNTAANPTLNVNGTGAKKIVVNGTENPGADLVKWSAFQTCIFTYDGSYWRFVGSDGETVRLKSAETAIEQNADAIALRATKTEAYQSAQPNLTPFFSQYKADVHSNTNPDGYWNQSSADGFPSLITTWDFEQETVNGNGWAHFVANNTGTVTLYAHAYVHKNALQLKPSTKYTFLVEWLDVVSTGGTPVLYTTTQHGGTGGVNNDYFTTTTSTSLTSGSGSKYISATTRDALDSGCNNRIRAHIWIGTGISTSGYIRISLYEGEYAGPYKPYSGAQLYASQSELKVANDNINLKVSKNDVINQINVSTEGVKIQASKVEIDGTAVFSAISSDVDDAITGKGYQTSSQVESAITSKGYQTSSQVNSAITSKGYQTSSQVESAITSKGYATTTQAQGYATTAKSEAISAAASDATSKANAAQTAATNAANEAYQKLRSQGIQLVTNGNGFLGDNTNWPLLTFDGSKSNGSPGSFTKGVGYATVMSAEMFPVDVSKEYLFEFDAISSDGNGRLYSFLDQYDVDGKSIVAQYVLYFANTLTTLAKDLNTGDTTVTLTSASNWASTSYDYQRALIFWDYKNSYGYTYPTETYSRNYYDSLYTDDSKVNKSTGVITLKKAWAGPKKAKGTYVSQGRSGNSYVYAHTYVQVPTEWTHYSFVYSGLDLVKDGNDGIGTFRQGTAFAKAGFLWNYNYPTVSQGQIWVTNVSVKEATAKSSNAVKRTQRIWYRTNASSAPATPGTASSNWVTKADDGNDAWTKMHIAISSTHKYIYTCEQYEMANGTVGYTSVLLDNTITVIDGGNIITGSVTANKLNAANINASKTLTVGAMTDAAASSILNSNVVVGGRNVASDIKLWYSRTSSGYVAQGITITKIDNGLYKAVGTTTQAGDIWWMSSSIENKLSSDAGQYTMSITIEKGTWPSANFYLQLAEYGSSWHANIRTDNGKTSKTFTCASGYYPRHLGFYSGASGISIDIEFRIKLERGNKATDWSPAPEDQTAYVDAIQVGGRNLFADSKALSTAKWTFDQGATRGDNLATLAANASSRIYQLPAYGYWSWKPNTEYVVSVEAKASASGGKMTFNMVGAGGNKLKTFDLTTSWARYSWAFTSDATVSTGSASIYNSTNTGTVQVRLPKLEEGNKATDWTPAPEDQTAYVDAIQVGGRNLLPKTGSADGYYANTVPSGSNLTTVNDDSECYERSVTSTSANIPMSSNVALVGLESGSEYTLSMMVKSTVARTFGLQLRKNNNGADGGEYVYQPGVNVAANTWTRLTYSFTGTSDAAVYARLYCAAGTACTVRMRELKLERGNKATDWTPAPEDQTEYTDSITYQTSKPNLVPWFSAGVPELPSTYWTHVTGPANTQLTDLGDGWCRIVIDNTAGTSTARYDYCPVAAEGIGLGKDYTMLFEFRNISNSTKSANVYTVQQGTYGMQFWGNYAKKVLQGYGVNCVVGLTDTISGTGNRAELCDDGIYRKRIVRTSEASDSTYWTRSDDKNCVTLVAFAPAGAMFDAEMRFSIYEGEYTGPYKPYSGTQLYASGTDVNELNASLIATEESLSGQIRDTNDSLRAVSAAVTKLDETVQNDRENMGRWLNFNESEGLTIGKAGSAFKVVTDETRQAFMYGNETLAYTSGDRFVAPRMEADELHIGNWMWVKRDNGNLSLKWIG